MQSNWEACKATLSENELQISCIYIYIYIFIYLFIYVFIYLYLYLCLYVKKQRERMICIVNVLMYRYRHTYIHAYIHAYIHTYIRTYIHTYIHAYTNIYTCTCLALQPGRSQPFLRSALLPGDVRCHSAVSTAQCCKNGRLACTSDAAVASPKAAMFGCATPRYAEGEVCGPRKLRPLHQAKHVRTCLVLQPGRSQPFLRSALLPGDARCHSAVSTAQCCKLREARIHFRCRSGLTQSSNVRLCHTAICGGRGGWAEKASTTTSGKTCENMFGPSTWSLSTHLRSTLLPGDARCHSAVSTAQCCKNGRLASTSDAAVASPKAAMFGCATPPCHDSCKFSEAVLCRSSASATSTGPKVRRNCWPGVQTRACHALLQAKI